ncbi:MAG: hypothetical protein M0R03_21870 [Novosphingobium sp.]|nr:hypothetical protein [Novosphingobium sp.]
MMTKILIKAGLKENLPVLDVKEPAYCFDTNELFVGTATGNVLVNRGMTLDELTTLLDNSYATKTLETTALLKSGGTMTGALTLNAAPTTNLQAATKKYVDDTVTSAVTAATQYKGAFDASKTIAANGITSIKAGDMWKVSVEGTASGITTPSSTSLQVGDIVIANKTKTTGIVAADFDGIDNTEATDILRKTTAFDGDVSGKYNTITIKDTAIAAKKPAFTVATVRANIATGETVAVILGKIAKYFTDLKTVAFTGSYNDLTNKPTIAAPSTTAPISVDGTASAVGVGTTYARADHKHQLSLATDTVLGGVKVDGEHITLEDEQLHVAIIDGGTF